MNIVVGVALALVVLALLGGLFNLARGGSPEQSQKLMRARVALQLVAMIVIMAVIWLRGG